MLRRFNEDKVKPLSTLMIVHSLEGPYHPADGNEEILEPEVPYLSIISALLYLTKCVRLDISFTASLLARDSYAPTRSRWNGIKDISSLPNGMTDMDLFYPYASRNGSKPAFDYWKDARLV
ncbi:hypothetical protein M0R45_034481 [Rubus argutus]|uniref:Uncharacterized protein n=1 Tax=Rubus argutus TaxID=59490 RepID=A0AAW1VUE5_RUBAR